jgi:hypothetical protein
MPQPHGAELKFVVTNTFIVRDIRRSVACYRDVLGATVLRKVRLSNADFIAPVSGRTRYYFKCRRALSERPAQEFSQNRMVPTIVTFRPLSKTRKRWHDSASLVFWRRA